ncbi:hypothetical protein ACFW88_35230 [Streptomyces anandii]|uniref:Uncharacterized protein n=1 Tax=Streptomyces anandii TaxID=285454 RepID=A0ABW6HGG5_9ACTN
MLLREVTFTIDPGEHGCLKAAVTAYAKDEEQLRNEAEAGVKNAAPHATGTAPGGSA